MMTKDEIKKALEMCDDADLSCGDCPYHDDLTCSHTLKTDARSLIIEQEQEIARLKAENIRLTTKLGQVLLSIDTVKEMNTMCSIDEQRKRAVQDFAEKLWNKIKDNGIDYKIGLRALGEEIDELLKEYEK